MKFLTGIIVAVLLIITSACSFVVQDTRTMPERTAHAMTVTATAQLGEIINTATPTPTVEIIIEPTATVTATATVECLNIKGNISKAGVKIYHMPGQANYNNVIIDPEHDERIFCSEEEAVANGWRKSLR